MYSGTFRVAAPIETAFALFTPLGERAWAAGWEPRFADPVPADDSAPGTVFTTDHGGHVTIWVVAEREPGASITYARVTPGVRAGTVRVRCAEEDGGTRVDVEYQLSDLGSGQDPFPHGFAAYLATWDEAIKSSL